MTTHREMRKAPLTKCRPWARLCFCLSALAFGVRVSAQTHSIDLYTIAGGSGSSTGGVYAVSGTIGQHEATGPMTGGKYSLRAGFWSLISVVQTPGAPALCITLAGNSVILTWPGPGSFTLQQNADPANPSGWTPSSYTVSTANGTNSVTLNHLAGNLFFRLRSP